MTAKVRKDFDSKKKKGRKVWCFGKKFLPLQRSIKLITILIKNYMRHLLVSVLLAFVIPAVAQEDHNGLYLLKCGNATMTIDGARGGKILSFKYGDQEAISQLKWPEAFGSTFWTSPQKEWYWPPVPEYDKKPYQVEEANGVLKMTSEVSDKLKYRIIKEFKTDELHQAISIDIGVVDIGTAAIDDLCQVVGRHVRGHTDGNTVTTIHQQIRHLGRHDGRLCQRVVEVGGHINGLLVEVVHDVLTHLGKTALGVTHGCWRVTVNRSEVTLTVNKRITHVPVLSHTDEGSID